MFLALSLSKNDLIALGMTAVVLLIVCGVLTGFLLYYKKKAKDEAVKGTRTSEFLSMLLDTKDKKLIKKKKKRKIISNVIFYCLLVLFIPVFIYAVSNRITNNRRPFGDKRVRVVASGSRSFKNEANKDYLEDETLRKEYSLDNQFSKNDRIIVSKPKSDADIHLYDVVVYENEKTNRTIIHRIIKIDDENPRSFFPFYPYDNYLNTEKIKKICNHHTDFILGINGYIKSNPSLIIKESVKEKINSLICLFSSNK